MKGAGSVSKPNQGLKLTGAAFTGFGVFWFIQRPRQLSRAFGGTAKGDAMGFVWNIMLSFDNDELWEGDEPLDTCPALERINAWIGSGQLVSLTSPTYAEDASFGMDANLYGGGFKHFDIEDFIAVVKAQEWKARFKVQLWVKGAEEGMGDEPFTLIKLGGGRAAGIKAAETRKRRAAGVKAAQTKRRRTAAGKAAATRKAKRANQSAVAGQPRK